MTFDRDAMRAAVRRLHRTMPRASARPAPPSLPGSSPGGTRHPAGVDRPLPRVLRGRRWLKHFTPDVLGADGIAGEIQYWREGLLVVGACGDGDPIVLDFTEGGGAVGYISHEDRYANPGRLPRGLRARRLLLCPSS